MRPGLRRQTIALLTAYAVTLQALLPALTLAIDAVGDRLRANAELCTNTVNSTGEFPRQPDSGCSHGLACAMAGCSGVGAALLREYLEVGPDVVRTAFLALRSAGWIASPTRLAHSARAPPRA
jgi:hypothetical protein